ncbi:hypothetical protein L917_15483 [Phytophthora nicotianae]|uniref:Uncharacterized protein n=1 Tax=Phytophthora nicotianae TaxID=4792 RepID=W2KHX0_PHYNI|nr:hypothetical protein L917_15483 [Phytophthora nicotianae]
MSKFRASYAVVSNVFETNDSPGREAQLCCRLLATSGRTSFAAAKTSNAPGPYTGAVRF